MPPTVTRTVARPPAAAIAVGPTVEVATTGDCLNLRAAPATTAAIVRCLPNGSAAAVRDGPRAAEGRTWWLLDSGGWAAADFLLLRGAGGTNQAGSTDLPGAIRANAQSKGWSYTGDCETAPFLSPGGPVHYCSKTDIRRRPDGTVHVLIGPAYGEIGPLVTFQNLNGGWRPIAECDPGGGPNAKPGCIVDF